jgi:hypothetical protein
LPGVVTPFLRGTIHGLEVVGSWLAISTAKNVFWESPAVGKLIVLAKKFKTGVDSFFPLTLF